MGADDIERLKVLRATLEEARFSPERAVTVNGRRVEFKTDAELRTALASLDERIDGASASRSFGVVRTVYDKGV